MSSTSPPTTAPRSIADLLPALAETFEHLLADGDTPTTALGVRLVDDDVELAVRSVERHPVDELLGFTGPPEWDAFGVAARGRTADGDPVRLVHIVARDASSWSHLCVDAAPPMTSPDQPAGLIDDLCRRVLGLPSAPPAVPPCHYWAARWLAAVLDLASTGSPSWAAVAGCHQAVTAITTIEPALGALAADGLVESGRALDRAYPWSALHADWSADGAVGLTGPEIAWMDEGMLSRWCLGSVPELTDLVDAVDALLSSGVAERIEATLRSWELVW